MLIGQDFIGEQFDALLKLICGGYANEFGVWSRVFGQILPHQPDDRQRWFAKQENPITTTKATMDHGQSTTTTSLLTTTTTESELTATTSLLLITTTTESETLTNKAASTFTFHLSVSSM